MCKILELLEWMLNERRRKCDLSLFDVRMRIYNVSIAILYLMNYF